MRSFFIIAPLSAILLSAAGAAVAGADPGSPSAPSANQPMTTAPLPPPATPSRLDPNVVICKREEATGTRLGPAKICHTRQEWAEMSAAARTSVGDMQSRANLGIPPK